MESKFLWDDHPSVLQYIGYFIVAIVIIVVTHFIQVSLYSYPWYAVSHISLTTALQDISVYWKILAIYGLYGVMIICVLFIGYYLIKSHRTRYSIRDDQLVVRRFSFGGVIEDRTELYRIVDFSMTQSFFGMIFGFSHVRLLTTDRARHVIYLQAVRRGADFLSLIRTETERCREEKGVREFTSGAVGNIDDDINTKRRGRK